MSRPEVSTTMKDGTIIKRYDLDGNETPDVVKYIEQYEDPDNPDVIRRRIRKKEVDVNSDGTIDIVKHYDEVGSPTKEQLDMNLDGTPDVISYFDNGNLVRKELLADDGKTVVGKRFYSGGSLKRVEKDKNGDGKTDYWEYYDEGVLQRIGRDINADEKIDKWVNR